MTVQVNGIFLNPGHRMNYFGERGGSVVERRTPERKVGSSKPTSAMSGIRNLPSPCCVIEQDTLLIESTGNH